MSDDDILIIDTVTKLDAGAAGKAVIAASHGGVYAGYLAARAGVRGVILHDAGVGLDAAGIGSLAYLEDLGIAAATIDYRSAIIGNGASLANDGVISFVNDTAAKAGCTPGQKAMDCAIAMRAAPGGSGDLPVYEEARFIIRDGAEGPIVRGCDSVSLVQDEDEDAVVITASHGEVLATSPTWGNRPKVLAAVFNDAGSDLVSRLPDLESLGIAAATVATASARIGDARSCYETGVISHVNDTAA
ncbi:MAG: hypothetical protein ACI8S3_002763, partial [Alphaproteobacteria bacterium]